jgi:hypothetical protein
MLAYAEQTGRPVNRVLAEALAEYRKSQEQLDHEALGRHG